MFYRVLPRFAWSSQLAGGRPGERNRALVPVHWFPCTVWLVPPNCRCAPPRVRYGGTQVSREAIRVPAVSFCGARPYSVGRRSPERRSGSTRPRQAAATRASASVPGLIINIIKGFPNFSIGCCFGGWFNLYIRVPGAKGSILSIFGFYQCFAKSGT